MKVLPRSSSRPMTLGATVGVGAFGKAYDAPTTGYLFKTGAIDFDKVGVLIGRRVVPRREGYHYAWPEIIGLDPASGEPISYAMRKAVDGIDLQAFLSAVKTPEWFRVRVARNLVRSLLDLEAAGYRRGDMPNTLVHQDASITEIDLDSLQVNHADCQFNGGQVKALTAPPEVLNHFDNGGVSGFETTREHDAWSLASLVFMLLMRGEHPFDAVRIGPSAAQDVLTRVKVGQWPHDPACLEAQPRPGALPFASLDPGVQRLFHQTFVDGHPNNNPKNRPSLQAWEAVLERLDSQT